MQRGSDQMGDRVSVHEDYWAEYLKSKGHKIKRYYYGINVPDDKAHYYKYSVCGAMFDEDSQGILYLMYQRCKTTGSFYSDPNCTSMLCKEYCIKDIIEWIHGTHMTGLRKWLWGCPQI